MSEYRDDFVIAIRSALLRKGAKQRYSLLFLITLSAAIFTLEFFQSKYTNLARGILNDGIYQFSSIASSPVKFTEFLITKSSRLSKTYDENKNLKKKLEILYGEQFNVVYLATENKRLKNALDIKNQSEEKLEFSKAIFDKNSPYLKSVIINKGVRAGIKKGVPVLQGHYLIGTIVETNYYSSRVLLISDLNSKIPVVLEPSGHQAILEGSGKIIHKLKYLPENFTPKEGNAIFTSGKDGILSSGIPIGRIIFLNSEEFGIELFADLSQISVVSTIVEMKKNKKEGSY